MKTLAYLDCPTGISGDMCLGALVDAGVPLTYLEEQLARLGMAHEYRLQASTVLRQGQAATQVQVILTSPQAPAAIAASPKSPPDHDHDHNHDHDHDRGVSDRSHVHPPSRHLQDIEALILQADLPARARDWSLAVFRQLARAEGAVHGIAPDQVHFHEVGATDAIVDIVGTCLGLDWLGIDQLICSPLPIGGGLVKAAHGLLPVPAPAVLKLLQMAQAPIYSNGLQKELVTPTGAAIATTLAQSFGPPPAMTLQTVGLGAGNHDLPIPNLLRLWLGHPIPSAVSSRPANPAQTALAETHASPHPLIPSPPHPLETIAVLATQIDDLTPQAIGYLYDRLLAAGALDMFTQTIAMKKSRPGFLVTVICRPDQVDLCETILFQETTTLGIRRQFQERYALSRSFQTVDTPYGPVHLKLAYHPQTQQLMNVQPEYEDCAAIARQHQLPWQLVQQAALESWYCLEKGTTTARKEGNGEP